MPINRTLNPPNRQLFGFLVFGRPQELPQNAGWKNGLEETNCMKIYFAFFSYSGFRSSRVRFLPTGLGFTFDGVGSPSCCPDALGT